MALQLALRAASRLDQRTGRPSSVAKVKQRKPWTLGSQAPRGSIARPIAGPGPDAGVAGLRLIGPDDRQLLGVRRRFQRARG